MHIKNSMILALAMAATACSSTMEPEKLVLRLMKQKFHEVLYTETKENGIIVFEDTEEQAGLSGSFKLMNNYLVVTIKHSFPDMSYSFSTGIFVNEKNKWVSLLQEDLVFGKLDTLIDLNGDQKNELIIREVLYESTRKRDEYILYAQLTTKIYEKIQTIAIDEMHQTFSYYENNKRIESQLNFEKSGDHILIVVNEHRAWLNEENGKEATEEVSYKYQWDPPSLVREDNVAANISSNSLIIHGKDIWVRDEPTTGKVVMKLNEGDKCKILEKDRLEIIRGTADYWYHIEFEGKSGWVFGSQTSKKIVDNIREFSSLDEVVKAFVFDSEDLPEVNHIVTFQENDFAIVSFNWPGGMTGNNFSWLGFKENDKWITIRFPGEAIKLIHKKDQLFVLMFIKSTGGAYTISNDYILYAIDPVKKSFIRQQIIFEYDNFEAASVKGEAILKFIDDKDDRIQITETMDHNYTEKRKGTFVTTYQFDNGSMTYKQIN